MWLMQHRLYATYRKRASKRQSLDMRKRTINVRTALPYGHESGSVSGVGRFFTVVTKAHLTTEIFE